jgi:hypothetical protein
VYLWEIIISKDIFSIFLPTVNHISGVMAGMLASRAVDLGVEPRSGQTPTWTHYPDSKPTSLCFFSLMLHALRRSNKYQFYSLWFDQIGARPQDLPGEYKDWSTHGTLYWPWMSQWISCSMGEYKDWSTHGTLYWPFYQRTLLGTSANQKRHYLKSYNNEH